MLSIQVALLVIAAISQESVDARQQEIPPKAKREFCPEGGGDADASCAYWKTLGFCDPSKGYVDFMERKCSASCLFCEARPTPPPRPKLVQVDVRRCLMAHNLKRAKHGARPLQWDAKLAKDAGVWALKLAKEDRFEHSPWNGQGENLFSITRIEETPITCEDAVQAWYDEIKDYPFYSPPRSVNDVKGKVIGHFTQLVWKSSRKLGVAISLIKRGLWYSTYVVARYTPPGNHNNQFSTMVGRLRG